MITNSTLPALRGAPVNSGRFATPGLLLLLSAATAGAIWLNESNLPAEADSAGLQFPAAFAVSTPTSPTIYGRIFEAGVTEAAGPAATVTAEVGYGPLGTDPRTNSLWVWFPATFNTQLGNDDEYQAIMTFAVSGSYSYTFRFSTDSTTNYTAADLDGAGSNGGLTFSPANLGTATVTLPLVLTNTFTYQGHLSASGTGTDGFYDLRFSIYDAGVGGNLMAGPVTNAAAPVGNGIFTAVITLTNAPFNGDLRWLELGVRSNAAGPFTILFPRQRLSESPYASHAFTAGALKVKGAGLGTSTPAFIHRATVENVTGSKTTIDHPLCNDDANALLFITLNYNPAGTGGTFDANPIAAAYDTIAGRWTIVNQNGSAMPVNAAFNVLIVKP